MRQCKVEWCTCTSPRNKKILCYVKVGDSRSTCILLCVLFCAYVHVCLFVNDDGLFYYTGEWRLSDVCVNDGLCWSLERDRHRHVCIRPN